MGSEPQFEIIRVFKGKKIVFTVSHNKEPPGQSLVCHTLACLKGAEWGRARDLHGTGYHCLSKSHISGKPF